MLQIFVNDRQVDLFDDTEVAITLEQPMLSTDHVPVPYSTDIELPVTSRNRTIFGFVDRHGRSAAFETFPARILFGGVSITSGEIKVSETGETITAGYNGVVIPEHIDRMAYRQDLGRVSLGKVEIDDDLNIGKAVWQACNNYYKALTNQTYPDMIAAPVAIDAREAWEISYVSPDFGPLTKQMSAAEWINKFDGGNGCYLPEKGYHADRLSQILPAFRVGWLFDRLLDGRCKKNIFNEGEWRRLMLFSLWHRHYNPESDAPVYDIDIRFNASLTFADFMPDKKANEILTELLKLPCASLYAKGDAFYVEFNRDILARKTFTDWTDKVDGPLTISEQEPQRYVYGYSREDDEISVELMPTGVASAQQIASLDPTSQLEPGTYEISCTGQVIERVAAEDATGIGFNVLRQSMNPQQDKDPDDARSDFEMTFGGSVPKTNICLQESTADNTQGHRWYYAPQVDEAQTERPDDLAVGLYYGWGTEICWNSKNLRDYPYMSHCNYDGYGNRLGDLSLSFTADDGLDAYHRDFRAWIEKPKKVVKCNVRLNAVDLHNLDLRDKVMINNRLYYINSITITLRPHTIEPSEAELIEV